MSGEMRPAVRELVKALRFRSTYGRPCYVKVTYAWAALIVPSLRDGADGPYELLRTVRRATLDEAMRQGLVILGVRGDVPATGGKHWSAQPQIKGRTITLTEQAAAESPTHHGEDEVAEMGGR